jgi:prepilin-type N-terminal cleavage/methylation domain-containing protein
MPSERDYDDDHDCENGSSASRRRLTAGMARKDRCGIRKKIFRAFGSQRPSQAGEPDHRTGSRGNRSTTMRSERRGFTLIELLVVLAIVLVLAGLLLAAMAAARNQRLHVLAATQIRDITGAAEAYYVATNQYPPDTGTIDTATGNTTAFSADDPAQADAIFRYLGCKVKEAGSATKQDYPLVIHPSYLRTFGSQQNVMVDPWGQPYRMDCVHVDITPGSAPGAPLVAPSPTITRIGAPYNASVPREKQVLSVKVWSAGPDKLEGSVPFSQVEKITDPVDQDNKISW